MIKVYNRHCTYIAGVAPCAEGFVTRDELARFPWALSAVVAEETPTVPVPDRKPK